jgi:hypothetical protein
MPNVAAIVCVLALAVCGCSSRDALEQTRKEQEGAAADAAGKQASSDCVRGEPEALLAAGSDFRKSPSHEAIEAVRADAPITLTIRHFGCTHYGLDFDFTWPGPQLPEPRISLNEAAQFLETLAFKEANRPLMKALAAALRKMSEAPYEQPLRMSETETLTATTPALNTLRVRYDVAL